jgi:hypothetical protein
MQQANSTSSTKRAVRKTRKVPLITTVEIAKVLMVKDGDYEQDCIIGGQFGWQLVQEMRADEMGFLLGSIILEMFARKGLPNRGRVVGFCGVFGDNALASKLVLTPEGRARLGFPA